MQNFNSPQENISIIIVNYRSDQHLEKCIASLYNFEKNIRNEIIVVNNDIEKNLEEISALFSEVKIFQTQENIGFGKAVNKGAREAKNEIFFLLNPDTEIKEEIFSKIIEEFAKSPEVAIISPQIKEKNGKTQEWTFGKKLTLTRLILNNLGFAEVKKHQEKKEVDWVSGAGMFVRKKEFLEAGGFDENFFMYFEDLDLCARIKKEGKKIIYLPTVELMHLGNGSLMEKTERKKEYFVSQNYYFRKHFGIFQESLVKIIRKIFG